jgi:hypothetical protein
MRGNRFCHRHNRLVCEDGCADRKSINPIGRRAMQKPFAYPAINPNVHNSFFSMWELPVLALVGAVMLFMISFALVNPSSAKDQTANGRLPPGEFSAGMPLP